MNDIVENREMKVIFGDARNMAEIPSSSIHLVVTSPPYWKMRGLLVWKDYNEYTVAMKTVLKEIFRVLKTGRVACINIGDYLDTEEGHKYPLVADFIKWGQELGFRYEDMIIWVKPFGAGTSSGSGGSGKRAGNFIKYGFSLYFRPNNRWEAIIIFRKGEINYETYPVDKRPIADWRVLHQYLGDVWEFPCATRIANDDSACHPAEFPEILPDLCIQFYSLPGETVLDPFLGSGTTIRSAIRLKRYGVGYEINPEYKHYIERKLLLSNTRLYDFEANYVEAER